MEASCQVSDRRTFSRHCCHLSGPAGTMANLPWPTYNRGGFVPRHAASLRVGSVPMKTCRVVTSMPDRFAPAPGAGHTYCHPPCPLPAVQVHTREDQYRQTRTAVRSQYPGQTRASPAVVVSLRPGVVDHKELHDAPDNQGQCEQPAHNHCREPQQPNPLGHDYMSAPLGPTAGLEQRCAKWDLPVFCRSSSWLAPARLCQRARCGPRPWRLTAVRAGCEHGSKALR